MAKEEKNGNVAADHVKDLKDGVEMVNKALAALAQEHDVELGIEVERVQVKATDGRTVMAHKIAMPLLRRIVKL